MSQPVEKTSLSIVYITHDAARTLAASLKSVLPLGGEILVVDSGSTDETVQLAQQYGARILRHAWEGFGGQRAFAVNAASHDWILMLDADEILRPETLPEIRRLIRDPGMVTGYYLKRYNHVGKKPIRHGDWARDDVLRLFHRRHGEYRREDKVHESWCTPDHTAHLKGTAIDHYSFDSVGDMLKKLQIYAVLNAEKVYARGKRISSLAPMTHAAGAFLRCYFFRLGFLDGMEGAAIASTTALGAFMKYAIALEMQERDDRSP